MCTVFRRTQSSGFAQQFHIPSISFVCLSCGAQLRKKCRIDDALSCSAHQEIHVSMLTGCSCPCAHIATSELERRHNHPNKQLRYSRDEARDLVIEGAMDGSSDGRLEEARDGFCDGGSLLCKTAWMLQSSASWLSSLGSERCAACGQGIISSS